MVGNQGMEMTTAAGGNGTLVPEDLLRNDGNGDPNPRILQEADAIIRTAERNASLIHGIGDYAVRPLGISAERRTQKGRIPRVLGQVSTVRYAPFKIG